MRVALVGVGDIGVRGHLPALARSADVEVAALVDPAYADGGKAPGMPWADLESVLGDESIPAVVLATPPWVTTGLVRRALAAGKYVLAEKPIATDLAQATALRGIEGVERLQVGFTYRHDPALAVLKDWIATGKLGDRLLIRAHIYDEQRGDPEHEQRVKAALRHGPPVLHDGAHLMDWLAYLLPGRTPRVADAWSMRTDDEVASPNLTGARLSYPGATVLVEVGWWADRLPPCEVSVLGDRGYAVLDCGTFRLTMGDEVVDPPGERTERCFDRQLAAFVELARGRAPRAVPGIEEALASLALTEEIRSKL